MWPPWGRAPRGPAAGLRSPSPPPNPAFSFSFSFSTFKDVQSLLHDEAAAVPGCKKPPVCHRVRPASSALLRWCSVPSLPLPPDEFLAAAAGEKRIVVYFTSLRVVRKTFEDCRAVRSILRGFGLAVDERDLSMDRSFLGELKGILGKKQLPLPRVFIGGRYVGGADEIRQLNETGELKRHVEGVPPAEPGVCGTCGGFRFTLCDACSGSHKCYRDKGGFRSCTACNENGLVRCPDCCRSDAI